MTQPAREPDDGVARRREEPIVRTDDPETPGDPRRSTATGRRAVSRIGVGIAAGVLTGVLLGALVGLLAFGGVSRGMWASVVAGAIFLGGLGAFWGGLGSLGPPEVENDPLPPAVDEPPGTTGGSSTVG